MSENTHQTNALLPCPFCGAAAHGYAIPPLEHPDAIKKLVPELPAHPGSYVIESQCDCGSGMIGATEDGVVARWNRRSPQQKGVEVAGQCRFDGANWAECSVEHVRMVLANPDEWQGYEVRYLYAAPQPVAREPLTDAALLALWSGSDSRPVLGKNKVLAFARAIERAHGITGEKA